MSKSKPPQSRKQTGVSIVRSSAAEYLTFVAATGNGDASVEMRYEDENLWLTQKMMATLYDVSVPAISQHLKRIYADNELAREATVKQYLMVQTEGDREVQRKVDHYSLQAIHSLPEDVRSPLHGRMDAIRRISHNFGYGVGDDMDDLLAEYGIFRPQ